MTQDKTYKIAERKLAEEEEENVPVIIPQISSEEAEKIIQGLDKQFEEKVMKMIKKEKNRETSQGPALPPDQDGSGRNLQDYLTRVRAERPAIPFADEDSHFDLSKLKNA